MAKIKPLTVNGIELRAPKTFDSTYKDIDSSNSYTSDRGILVRDMIRANHHTFKVAWQSITGDELKVILQAISGKASFTLRYWDVHGKADHSAAIPRKQRLLPRRPPLPCFQHFQ